MTTVAPSLGHGPVTQLGVGSTPGYDAIDLRRLMTDPELGEGVPTYGTYRISQRAAGANMSVDVNMDDFAYIRGDAVSFQGIYKVAPHSATINEAIAAADATNPRVDRVVLEVKDTTHDASGSNLAQTRVITGTPTGGATLDNLSGAGAVPSSALLLADVLVGAAAASITDSVIRDRRAFVAGVPPLLTDVDMAVLEFVAGIERGTVTVGNSGSSGHTTTRQAAALVRLNRRIVGATRIRWKYHQSTAAAWVGNYVLALFDASGRAIIDTGSVAATGALDTYQTRSETITATTFEPALYYLFFGAIVTSGSADFHGALLHQANLVGPSPSSPNLGLRATSGGVTVPQTLLTLADLTGVTIDSAQGVPQIALSVG